MMFVLIELIVVFFPFVCLQETCVLHKNRLSPKPLPGLVNKHRHKCTINPVNEGFHQGIKKKEKAFMNFAASRLQKCLCGGAII